MMTATDTGWSEPEMVMEPVSSENDEFFPSVTNDNTLYFTRMTKEGKSGIYRSLFENGRYLAPELLRFDIPETAILFNAFISPEEDYLITCARGVDSTNTDQDYYISFRSSDGSWSDLIRFGPDINAIGDNASSAYVSPDGKYLFFSSSRKDPEREQVRGGTTLGAIINAKSQPGNGSSSIYWVDAGIIEDLRAGLMK
jgi:hypothetical protein